MAPCFCSAPGCADEVHAKGLCVTHYRRQQRTGLLRLATPEVRFWRKVNKGSGSKGCWIWFGAVREGHGYWRGRKAHRVAWEYLNGPLRADQVLRQTCEVRLCVRPAHMRVTATSSGPRP